MRQSVAWVGRIVDAADFERALKAPAAARTQHFAVHHLVGGPKPRSTDLSTATVNAPAAAVDGGRGAMSWLGYVVPKRHARRAVTRSLLKRQIRAAVDRRPRMSDGLWVVRLRAAFDRAAYPSAASTSLARAARAELDLLLAQAARRVGDASTATGHSAP